MTVTKKSTLGIKVGESVRAKYDQIKEASGLEAEELLGEFCDMYAAQGSCTSAVSSEVAQVRKSFKQAEDVLVSFLTIVNDEKESAVQEAFARNSVLEELAKKQSAENAQLVTDIKSLAKEKDSAQQDKTEALAKLASLEEQLENTAALKEAWVEKETILTSSIADLTVKNEGLAALEKNVIELERENVELQNSMKIVENELKNSAANGSVLIQENEKLKISVETTQQHVVELKVAAAEAKGAKKLLDALEKQLEQSLQDKEALMKMLKLAQNSIEAELTAQKKKTTVGSQQALPGTE